SVVAFGTGGGEVAEAVLTADAALVDARELPFVVVEGSGAERARLEVQAEAVEARDLGVPPGRAPRHLGRHEEELLVAVDVEDDLAALVVRVQRMEDVAGIGLEPADVLAPAAPRHDADAGAALRLPREDRSRGGRFREVEDDRAEEEDRVVLG